MKFLEPAPRPAWPRSVWLAVASVCLTIGGPRPAFAHEGHAPLPTKGATVQGDRLMLSGSAAKAIDLKTTKISLGNLDRTVVANATVDVPCHHHAFSTTLVTGKVTEVLVHPGDSVAVGQELARIESVTLEALQLEMLQSSEQLALAEKLLEERERISTAISAKTLLETRATRKQKAAQFGVVWQKLRSLGMSEQQLETVRASNRPQRVLAITSPLAGIVSEADVRVGQIVEPTEHLYHIVDRSQAWMIGEVLESDSAGIRVGLPAVVTLDGVADRRFEGRIEYVGLAINPEKHTLAVRVTIDNAEDLLHPGMFGRMAIPVAVAAQAVVCPTEALLNDAQGAFVLLEEGPGKYLRKPVSLGLRTPASVEVRDGVFPGDRVVTTGNHELAALFGGRAALVAANGDRTVKPTLSQPTDGSLLVAQAQVELPTNRKAFASSNIQGKILRIFAERGDQVTAGAVLAEVESLELKTWQLDLLQTRVLSALTKTSLDRMEPLVAQGAIPERDLWQLRSKYQSYAHAERSLTQKLRMVGLADEAIERIEQIDLSDPRAGEQISTVLPIRAPMDGAVADFELGIGQVVNPDQHLFEIQDASRVWIKGFIFERDAGRVRVGQQVEVQLVSDPTISIPARISRISPVLSSTERAVSVWAEVDNTSRRMKEGMLARMLIRTAAPTTRVAVEETTPRAPQ